MRHQLPPGLRARTTSSGNTFYYLKRPGTGSETPLGPDRCSALKQWQQSRLAAFVEKRSVSDLVTLIDAFILCAIPARDPADRPALLKQSAALRQYFLEIGNPRSDHLSVDQDAYLKHHECTRRHRAGAEIHLFLHIWSWGQRNALLRDDAPCPWDSRTTVVSRQTEILNELRDAIHQMHASGPDNAGAGKPSRHPDALTALRQRIAAQLTADGRCDMARYLRQLPLAQFHALLSGLKRSLTAPPESELLLNTARATRLQKLRQHFRRTGRNPCD
jgi:hypothetical protein